MQIEILKADAFGRRDHKSISTQENEYGYTHFREYPQQVDKADSGHNHIVIQLFRDAGL